MATQHTVSREKNEHRVCLVNEEKDRGNSNILSQVKLQQQKSQHIREIAYILFNSLGRRDSSKYVILKKKKKTSCAHHVLYILPARKITTNITSFQILFDLKMVCQGKNKKIL